jgi:uncharacterized protein (TIGR03118 family)
MKGWLSSSGLNASGTGVGTARRVEPAWLTGTLLPPLVFAMAVICSVTFFASSAWAQYTQTNLVGNTTEFNPKNVDPNLVDGWGLAALPNSPWWLSAQNTVSSPLYDARGRIEPLLVDLPCVTDTTTGTTTVPCIIPPGAIFEPNNPAATPFTAAFGSGSSGIVANTFPNAFEEHGEPAQFIFATLDGLIVAWNPANGTQGVVEANQFLSCTNPSLGPGSCTSYQGLAIAGPPHDPHLYGANLFGEIDVFDKHFKYETSFVADSNLSSLPSAEQPFVPYGIQAIGDKLYVTYYAVLYINPINGTAGNGILDVCDLSTSITAPSCRRIIDSTLETSPTLAGPWGMALAPEDFGPLSHKLLVGNVDDGLIHAFDPQDGGLIGTLNLKDGKPFALPGLWGLAFGDGSRANGPRNSLYFSAGPSTTTGNPPNDTYQYAAGLFGVIKSADECDRGKRHSRDLNRK